MDSRFSLVGSTTSLRITKIQEADGGIYQCRAANTEDSVDASATIQVQVSGTFYKYWNEKINPCDLQGATTVSQKTRRQSRLCF